MKQNDGELIITSEDAQCWVICVCGTDISIYDAWVTRCPDCGRGYRTEFVVWIYDQNENDPHYPNTGEHGEALK